MPDGGKKKGVENKQKTERVSIGYPPSFPSDFVWRNVLGRALDAKYVI